MLVRRSPWKSVPINSPLSIVAPTILLPFTCGVMPELASVSWVSNAVLALSSSLHGVPVTDSSQIVPVSSMSVPISSQPNVPVSVPIVYFGEVFIPVESSVKKGTLFGNMFLSPFSGREVKAPSPVFVPSPNFLNLTSPSPCSPRHHTWIRNHLAAIQRSFTRLWARSQSRERSISPDRLKRAYARCLRLRRS